MGFKMVRKPTCSLCIEKIELKPNIIGKLLICQGIFSKKNTQCQWIDTTIQPDDTGQWIPCFDSSQNIIY